MEETMRPTTAFDDNVFDITALLHPGSIFDHPRDVVAHPSLSISEKRAILASWASDASAIASCPALRAPASLKAPVTIDEILEALGDRCRLISRAENGSGLSLINSTREQNLDRARLRHRHNVIRFSEGLAATEITVPPLEPKSHRIIVC
jgi:hypothetical protein